MLKDEIFIYYTFNFIYFTFYKIKLHILQFIVNINPSNKKSIKSKMTYTLTRNKYWFL